MRTILCFLFFLTSLTNYGFAEDRDNDDAIVDKETFVCTDDSADRDDGDETNGSDTPENSYC